MNGAPPGGDGAPESAAPHQNPGETGKRKPIRAPRGKTASNLLSPNTGVGRGGRGLHTLLNFRKSRRARVARCLRRDRMTHLSDPGRRIPAKMMVRLSAPHRRVHVRQMNSGWPRAH